MPIILILLFALMAAYGLIVAPVGTIFVFALGVLFWASRSHSRGER